jgi:hypothetical protein
MVQKLSREEIRRRGRAHFLPPIKGSIQIESAEIRSRICFRGAEGRILTLKIRIMRRKGPEISRSPRARRIRRTGRKPLLRRRRKAGRKKKAEKMQILPFTTMQGQ